MTKKYITLVTFFISIIHFSIAQEVNKVRVHSISSLGILNGNRGSSLALQTILGASYKKTFLGIGGGLDYYRYRSIPVFADLRHEFGKGKRTMFLYGDLGYNYDWLVKEKSDNIYIYELNNRFSGGLYYDVGIGYKIGITNRDAFLLSAGFSFKKLKSETGNSACSINGPCYDYLQTYRYYLSRFAIKAGWQF